MFSSRWDFRWRARVPPSGSRSANGQRLTKSRRLETRCRKLSNVCTRERAPMPLPRQLEFAFRSTGILRVGQAGVSPDECVIEPAGRIPDGPTAETAGLLQT